LSLPLAFIFHGTLEVDPKGIKEKIKIGTGNFNWKISSSEKVGRGDQVLSTCAFYSKFIPRYSEIYILSNCLEHKLHTSVLVNGRKSGSPLDAV
jgi:hypothetical protein